MNDTYPDFINIINVFFLAVNAIILYFTVIYGRKKDFEDDLYKRKLDAYNFLSNECYQLYKRLDINSTPFVHIYDIETEEEWIKHCTNNMNELHHLGFDLQDTIYKYAVYLPNPVIDKLINFSNHCLSFVTMSYHFDTELIIKNQDHLWDLYLNLLTEFRKDLSIEAIDHSLRERMTETMNNPK